MRITLLALAIAVGACTPADPNIRTVRERLEAGEVVEFSEMGYRRPSCSPKKPDWTEYGTNEKSRQRIVLRQENFLLQPGRHSCFRIGSELAITTSRNGGVKARAIITKLALVKLDKMTASNLNKSSFYASDDEFAKLKAGMKPRLKPFHNGVVTVAYLHYIRGSAPDEDEIRTADAAERAGDGYSETTADGQTLSLNCTPWSTVVVAQDYIDAAIRGDVRSWYKLGDFNCMPQGLIAGVTASPTGVPAGQVKVTKIKKFRIAHLDPTVNPKYFNLPQDVWSVVYSKIQMELANSTKKNEWMTVTDFVPVTSGGTP